MVDKKQQTPNSSHLKATSYLGSTQKRTQSPFSRRTWDVNARVSSPFRRLAETNRRPSSSVSSTVEAQTFKQKTLHKDTKSDEVIDWIKSIKQRAQSVLQTEEEEEKRFYEEIEREKRQVDAQNQINTESFDKLRLYLDNDAKDKENQYSIVRNPNQNTLAELESYGPESGTLNSGSEEIEEIHEDEEDESDAIDGQSEEDLWSEEDAEDEQQEQVEEEESSDENEESLPAQQFDEGYDSEGNLKFPDDNQLIQLSSDEEDTEGPPEYDPNEFAGNESLEYVPTPQYESMYAHQRFIPNASLENNKDNEVVELSDNDNEAQESHGESEDELEYESEEQDYEEQDYEEQEYDQHGILDQMQQQFDQEDLHYRDAEGAHESESEGDMKSERAQGQYDYSRLDPNLFNDLEDVEVPHTKNLDNDSLGEYDEVHEEVEDQENSESQEEEIAQSVQQNDMSQFELLASAALTQLSENAVTKQSAETEHFIDATKQNLNEIDDDEEKSEGQYSEEYDHSAADREESIQDVEEDGVEKFDRELHQTIEHEGIEQIHEKNHVGELLESKNPLEVEGVSNVEGEDYLAHSNGSSEQATDFKKEEEQQNKNHAISNSSGQPEQPEKQEDPDEFNQNQESEEEYVEEQYYDSDNEPFRSPSHSLFGSLTVDEISAIQDQDDDEYDDAGSYNVSNILGEVDEEDSGHEQNNVRSTRDVNQITEEDTHESRSSSAPYKQVHFETPCEEATEHKPQEEGETHKNFVSFFDAKPLTNEQSIQSFSEVSEEFAKTLRSREPTPSAFGFQPQEASKTVREDDSAFKNDSPVHKANAEAVVNSENKQKQSFISKVSEKADDILTTALGEDPESFVENSKFTQGELNDLVKEAKGDTIKDLADNVLFESLGESAEEFVGNIENATEKVNNEVFTKPIGEIVEDLADDARHAAKVSKEVNDEVFAKSIGEVAQDFVADASDLTKESLTDKVHAHMNEGDESIYYDSHDQTINTFVEEGAKIASDAAHKAYEIVEEAIETSEIPPEGSQEVPSENLDNQQGETIEPKAANEVDDNETKSTETFGKPKKLEIPDIVKNAMFKAIETAGKIEELGEDFVDDESKPQVKRSLFTRGVSKPSSTDKLNENSGEVKNTQIDANEAESQKPQASNSESLENHNTQKESQKSSRKRKLEDEEEEEPRGLLSRVKKFAKFVGTELDASLDNPVVEELSETEQKTCTISKGETEIGTNFLSTNDEETLQKDNEEFKIFAQDNVTANENNARDMAQEIGDVGTFAKETIEEMVNEPVDDDVTTLNNDCVSHNAQPSAPTSVNDQSSNGAANVLLEEVSDLVGKVEEKVEEAVENQVYEDDQHSPNSSTGDKRDDLEGNKDGLLEHHESIAEGNQTSVIGQVAESIEEFGTFVKDKVEEEIDESTDQISEVNSNEPDDQGNILEKVSDVMEHQLEYIETSVGDLTSALENKVEEAIESQVADESEDGVENVDISGGNSAPENAENTNEENQGMKDTNIENVEELMDTDTDEKPEEQVPASALKAITENSPGKNENEEKEEKDQLPELKKGADHHENKESGVTEGAEKVEKFELQHESPEKKEHRSPFKKVFDYFFTKRVSNTGATKEETDVKKAPGSPAERPTKRRKKAKAPVTSDFHDHIIMKTRSGKIIGANSDVDIAEAEQLEQAEETLIDRIAHGELRTDHVLHDLALEHERDEEKERLNHLKPDHQEELGENETAIEQPHQTLSSDKGPNTELLGEQQAGPQVDISEKKEEKVTEEPKEENTSSSPNTPKKKGRGTKRSRTESDYGADDSQNTETTSKGNNKHKSKPRQRRKGPPPPSERQLRSRTK